MSSFITFILLSLTISVATSCVNSGEISIDAKITNSQDSQNNGNGSGSDSGGSGSDSGGSGSGSSTPPAPNTMDDYTVINFTGLTSFDSTLQSMFTYPLDPNDVNNVTVSGGKMTLTLGTSLALANSITNNSIIDLHFSRSYGSSSADGKEALFIYSTAVKDTLSRSVDGLPTFPSQEAFGFYTFSSSYNVRMGHNINNTGTYGLRFDSHRIYIPDLRGNGSRLWRVRFVIRDGVLKATLNWQGTNTAHYGQQWISGPGYTSEPNILTMNLPNSFDYNDMTFEMIGNRSMSIQDIKVSELLECTIPETIPSGYTSNCSAGELKTEIDCNIACDTSTHKIDSTKAFPILTCSTEGEVFEFSGCILK